ASSWWAALGRITFSAKSCAVFCSCNCSSVSWKSIIANTPQSPGAAVQGGPRSAHAATPPSSEHPHHRIPIRKASRRLPLGLQGQQCATRACPSLPRPVATSRPLDHKEPVPPPWERGLLRLPELEGGMLQRIAEGDDPCALGQRGELLLQVLSGPRVKTRPP